MNKIQKSIHPDDDLHYAQMGLKKNEVEIRELMYFGKSCADEKYREKNETK